MNHEGEPCNCGTECEEECFEKLGDNCEEIEKLKKEAEEYKDRFLRIAAEYENFKKRTEREKEAIYADATAFSVLCILPIADSLEVANKNLENVSEEYKKGLELVTNQLNSALKVMNVEAFGELGDEFDPNLHNAVAHIEEEGEKHNCVSTVYQKGYKMGERVIRHAMVQVTN